MLDHLFQLISSDWRFFSLAKRILIISSNTLVTPEPSHSQKLLRSRVNLLFSYWISYVKSLRHFAGPREVFLMQLLILSSAYRTDISLSRGHYLYLYGPKCQFRFAETFCHCWRNDCACSNPIRKKFLPYLRWSFFDIWKDLWILLNQYSWPYSLEGVNWDVGGRASLLPTSTHLPLPCCLVTNASTRGHASAQYPCKRSSVTWQSHLQQCSGH